VAGLSHGKTGCIDDSALRLYRFPVDRLIKFDLFPEGQFFLTGCFQTQLATGIGTPETVDTIDAGMFFGLHLFHTYNYKQKRAR